MSPDAARAFGEEWIAAWNTRDLGRILSHYAPEIEFTSPVALRVVGMGHVSGIEALRDYWSRALPMVPDLHFELESVLVGHQSVTILYRNQRGQRVAESCLFNAAGKVERSIACYAA
ncbi:MAG: nuclear transport factor 2 family protein [Hyphomicrobiaceae bacterium]